MAADSDDKANSFFALRDRTLGVALPPGLIELAQSALDTPEDVRIFSMIMAGVAPAAAVVLWAHVRAFGWRREGIFIDEPPVWVAFLVLIGGGAAVLFGEWGLFTLLAIDHDFAWAFAVGNAMSVPSACYILWITRQYWRNPGSYWEATEQEEQAEAARHRPRFGRRGDA